MLALLLSTLFLYVGIYHCRQIV